MTLDGRVLVGDLVTIAGDPNYYKAVRVGPGYVKLTHVPAPKGAKTRKRTTTRTGAEAPRAQDNAPAEAGA